MKPPSQYKRRTSRGLCGNCREPNTNGKSLCDRCRSMKVSAYKRRREKGLCGYCLSPAVPGKTRCQPCLDKASKTTIKVQSARRASGLCSTGGCQNQVEPGRQYCRFHMDKKNTSARARRLKKKNSAADCTRAEQAETIVDHAI